MYHFEEVWGPAIDYGPPALCLSDRWDLNVVLDAIDYEWANRWQWGHTWGSGKVSRRGILAEQLIYARRATRVQQRPITLYLHREICIRAYGDPPTAKHLADHRNGDTLDCRRENLRWATPSQNRRNIKGSAREVTW